MTMTMTMTAMGPLPLPMATTVPMPLPMPLPLPIPLPMTVFGAAAVAWLVGALAWLARADLATHRLPDRVLLPALAGAVALLSVDSALTGDWHRLAGASAAALAACATLLALHLVGRGALGFGDVKLAAVTGLATGWLGGGSRAALALAAAFVAAGLVAATLLVLVAVGVGAHHRASRIAFGPWLVLGAFATMAGDLAAALR